MAEIGLQTIYEHNFPYMLTPPNHSWVPGFGIVAIVFGALLTLAGAGIVFQKMTRQISLLLGAALLLVFCCWFVPYQFIMNPNYLHLGEWENAEKELALAGGAFVIAGCFTGKSEGPLFKFLGRLAPTGAILFAITMVSFGILHFLFATQVTGFVPSWIPFHLFWIYFAGVALIGSGVAIILRIKVPLIASLLGLMIFIWVVSLHIPRVIAAAPADRGGELTSAIIALAYSGIAFVIAGNARRVGRSEH